MIDIIRGASNKPISTDSLIKFVESLDFIDAVLYTGYPISVSLEESSSLDALLISSKYGLIVFDVVEEPNFSDRSQIRDTLYNIIFQKLIGIKELAASRGQLKVPINVLTIAPSWNERFADNEVIVNQKGFQAFFDRNSFENFSNIIFKKTIQTIQAITKLKGLTPRKVNNNNSKGAVLNELEKSISNLDRGQSKAVIETVDGIQRIRGLAGSGKTIVLALKVAYLHTKFPDWKIGVTFYTRSLKNQFIELINKFTIEHKNEEPDWSKIKIQQAWGSSKDNGFYYEFCKTNNIEYFDFDGALRSFGQQENILGSLCSTALSQVKTPIETYDVILVDEAQDFTESFLKLCYSMLKPVRGNNAYNKRLIYAYDELQKLNDANSLKNPTEMFPGVDFDDSKDKPQHDIFLRKCYRNSAPVLVTAHALGFGIYRKNAITNKNELVTMFRDKELWTDVGYIIDSGKLEFGKKIILKRDEESSPEFITDRITNKELIQFEYFASNEEQYKFVADEIEKNLTTDELTFKDIIVIHPNPLKAKNELALIRSLLFKKGIESHLTGVSTSPDDFFMDQSITFTSIYRAKGNEAAMVYIVGSEYCYGGQELIKKRNILFTSITRSKAWVRICGIGPGMMGLRNEFQNVEDEKFKLNFQYPTLREMENLNVLHRDLSNSDRQLISESTRQLSNLVEKFKEKKLHLQDLPFDQLEDLRKLLNGD